MRKSAWSLLALLGLATAGHAAGCRRIDYAGLGSLPVKDQASLLGTGLLSTPETNARVVAIHPGGTELFFTLLQSTGPQIMRSVFRDGAWQSPALASFSDLGVNTEPSISPDGRTLYFVSNRPPSAGTDIWKTERSGEGWGAPVRLGDAVNSGGYEWHPQVTANGDLYFAADDRADGLGGADLYAAKFVKGELRRAENLGAVVNSAAQEWDGYVDPSSQYLVFKSNRAGGFGGLDMYISVRERGSWAAPRNLGPAVNTADDEDSGEVTPDGRVLTFARSTPGAQFWRMYWIDARTLGVPATQRKCR